MEKKDFIVDMFDLERASVTFPIICVYDSPDDYPGKFVARLWNIDKPTRIIALADTAEEMRAKKPENMTVIPHHPDEAAVIVETWV